MRYFPKELLGNQYRALNCHLPSRFSGLDLAIRRIVKDSLRCYVSHTGQDPGGDQEELR